MISVAPVKAAPAVDARPMLCSFCGASVATYNHTALVLQVGSKDPTGMLRRVLEGQREKVGAMLQGIFRDIGLACPTCRKV